MRRIPAFSFVLFALLLMFSTANAQYVGSSKSDKYHKEDCRHAKNILEENRVDFESVEDAREAGYVACKVCKPAAAASGKKQEVRSNDTPPASSGRCQATTKKGTQCKRKASAGSQYCWQHG